MRLPVLYIWTCFFVQRFLYIHNPILHTYTTYTYSI